MNDPIQIKSDIAVQVIDSLEGKLTTGFLYPLHMRETVLLQLLQQQPRLLIIIIILQLLHKPLNPLLLLLNHIIEWQFHPHEHSIYIAILLLHPHVLLAIQEVVLCCEFLPELLAPFCQDTQDRWTFYGQVAAVDLLLRVGLDIFGDLAADGIVGVFLDLLLVFLLISHHILQLCL